MHSKTKFSTDWDDLGFKIIETKSMFKTVYDAKKEWAKGGLFPYEAINISPASSVLNYGQGVFEGMKATRTRNGDVVLFRPEMNAKRIRKSARRLCIPPIDETFFLNSVRDTVLDNIDYIPPLNRGNLYIRPIIWGTGPVLGVQPASEYTFLIYVVPVGPYFKNGIRPLNLTTTISFHRSAPKGIGNIKAIGNYSASLYPLLDAKSKGFDEVIYLDAKNENQVEETSSANIFVVKNNILKTPALKGAILEGVTRDSIITIAKHVHKLDVIEDVITVHDLINADEVFCTGTAVVVTPIGKINHNGKEKIICGNSIGPITNMLRKSLIQIQLQDVPDPFNWVKRLV